MTLFSRLQECAVRLPYLPTSRLTTTDRELRNSLPAVLNLIEAAQAVQQARDLVIRRDDLSTYREFIEVLDRHAAAVAVFVSGQEEPK